MRSTGRWPSTVELQCPARKAGVRFALHDFQGAMELADRVLAIAAGDVGAMAIDADARPRWATRKAGAEYEQLATSCLDRRLTPRLACSLGDDADALRLATDARDAARHLERIDDPASTTTSSPSSPA
jgi:hypothetical protein